MNAGLASYGLLCSVIALFFFFVDHAEHDRKMTVRETLFTLCLGASIILQILAMVLT